MPDHLSISVAEIAETERFYSAALAPLGYKRVGGHSNSIGFGKDNPNFWLSFTQHPVMRAKESRLRFYLAAENLWSVHAFYDAALAAGGEADGEPGLRDGVGENYYAATIIAPDGHRVEAYCNRFRLNEFGFKTPAKGTS